MEKQQYWLVTVSYLQKVDSKTFFHMKAVKGEVAEWLREQGVLEGNPWFDPPQLINTLKLTEAQYNYMHDNLPIG